MSTCLHTEPCECYRLGINWGMADALQIFTAGDDVELVLGKSLEDALREDDLETVLEKIFSEKDFNKFLAREFQTRATYEADRPVREMFQEAFAKWNAQGEVENAIANAFYHFPKPGGSKGRYHDTLCGENIHWTHVAHLREGDAEAEQRAISEVTCPVCLENLSTTS